MAQLGDLRAAAELLTRAHATFETDEALSRARCVLALAEVALALRDFSFEPARLQDAAATLKQHGDHNNALLAELLNARRRLLLGDIAGALSATHNLRFNGAPEALIGLTRLIQAQIAIRQIRGAEAELRLSEASAHSKASGIAALSLEIQRALSVLHSPAGRLVEAETQREVTLTQVEQLFQEPALLVDACRRQLRHAGMVINLSRRPILFSLLLHLAKSVDRTATRTDLVQEVFGSALMNDSYRARLRVEVGRLRKLLAPIATVTATAEGFKLEPHDTSLAVRVLLPPLWGSHPDILALLSDGQTWSASAIANALGKSQRSVQRALAQLAKQADVVPEGVGPARRWVSASLAPIATALLLPLHRD